MEVTYREQLRVLKTKSENMEEIQRQLQRELNKSRDAECSASVALEAARVKVNSLLETIENLALERSEERARYEEEIGLSRASANNLEKQLTQERLELKEKARGEKEQFLALLASLEEAETVQSADLKMQHTESYDFTRNTSQIWERLRVIISSLKGIGMCTYYCRIRCILHRSQSIKILFNSRS